MVELLKGIPQLDGIWDTEETRNQDKPELAHIPQLDGHDDEVTTSLGRDSRKARRQIGVDAPKRRVWSKFPCSFIHSLHTETTAASSNGRASGKSTERGTIL